MDLMAIHLSIQGPKKTGSDFLGPFQRFYQASVNDAPFVQMFQGSNQTSHVKGAGRTPRSIFQEDLIQGEVDLKSFNSENERMTIEKRGYE